MVAIIRVATIHDEHPELSLRALTRVGKTVYGEIGRKWADELLPDHFKIGADATFGYAPRRAKTIARKKRLAAMGLAEDGGTRPLVRSGRLRRMLTTVPLPVAAYPTRATVDLTGPPYLSINYRPGRPNLAAELMAMSDRHSRIIDETAERVYERAMSREQRRKTHRTR